VKKLSRKKFAIMSSITETEWKSMRLHDFVTLQRGHDLTESERHPGNIPVYGSFGMSGFHNAAKAKGPGVTVGRSGASFGVVNYCPVDFWPHNTALYVIDFHGNDEKFAYYYLKNLDFTRFNSGSAQASLNRNYIHPMEVKIPPLPTQLAIAYILGSLDDKIELNRQMNETLEAMARAIHQSWFVDFDPVRAKAEGRDTGLPADIAALFPSEIVEVDGREVPRGWGIGRLDELMILQRGFDLPKTQIEEGPYPVVCAGGVIGKHNKFMAKGPGITTGRSGVIGKVFFIQEDFWPHNTSLWVREFKISKPHHAFFTLQNLDLNVFNAGSAVATLNRNHIHNFPVLLPLRNIVDKFEAVVQPLFLLIHYNEQQSRTLAQIRDALLPKLMSGEILP
jgi:type I restriction enzyme S subunit